MSIVEQIQANILNIVSRTDEIITEIDNNRIRKEIDTFKESKNHIISVEEGQSLRPSKDTTLEEDIEEHLKEMYYDDFEFINIITFFKSNVKAINEDQVRIIDKLRKAIAQILEETQKLDIIKSEITYLNKQIEIKERPKEIPKPQTEVTEIKKQKVEPPDLEKSNEIKKRFKPKGLKARLKLEFHKNKEILKWPVHKVATLIDGSVARTHVLMRKLKKDVEDKDKEEIVDAEVVVENE